MSRAAENFGMFHVTGWIFWAFNLNFTILRTVLIFGATHLCSLSLRATQPGFVRTQGKWSTQPGRHLFSTEIIHHFAYPSFSCGSKSICILQQEESAHVRYSQIYVFLQSVVSVGFVSLQFSIATTAKSAVLLLLEVFIGSSNLFLYLLQIAVRSQNWHEKNYVNFLEKCCAETLSKQKYFQLTFSVLEWTSRCSFSDA